jgi:hypothetical protein
LKKKIYGYNNQDKLKGRYCNTRKLKINDVLRLIINNGMNCYYCGIETKLDYCNYSHKQLTLDRIYNHDNHNINNVLICCLKCNIFRSNDYSSADFKKLFQSKH